MVPFCIITVTKINLTSGSIYGINYSIELWFHIWYHLTGDRMDRLKKLYQKAQVSPWNYSYNDLCWLVEKVGFEFSGGSGDHDKMLILVEV